MNAEFWLERWQQGRIGFHEGRPNALLTAHFDSLSLAPAARVFVPLCGKTRDIAWLLARGYRVAGAELSEAAIEQLFEELDLAPDIETAGALKRYRADGIDIFVGDLFDLGWEALGPVDAIYDRAALVAMPEDMRARYAAHLMDITDAAPQLVICFEYDQSAMEGPPFSIGRKEISRLYGERYDIAGLASEPLEGGLKGTIPARESVWRLR